MIDPNSTPQTAAAAGLADLFEQVDAERASGIHRFWDSATAYDATQCREDINDGDVLVVEEEQVVGFLVEAWPHSITEEHGEFHALTIPVGDYRDGKYVEAAARAAKIARELGCPVHPGITDLVDEPAEADEAPAAGDVIRVAVRAFRNTGPLATVHINCKCPLKSSLIGTYVTLAEAEKAAAEHRPDVAPRRCKLSGPLLATTAPEFAAGDRVICPDGAARTVKGMYRAKGQPTAVIVDGGSTVDPAKVQRVDTSRIPEARRVATLYAVRVRTNPDPNDPVWAEALRELTEALRYLEQADPLYAEVIAKSGTERLTLSIPRTDVLKGDVLHAFGARLTVNDTGVTGARETGQCDWWAEVHGVTDADRAKTYRSPWKVALPLGDAAWDVVTVERDIHAPDLRQIKARPVVEAVVPGRPATGEGVAPRHAGHPDIDAAREALRPLRPAVVADDTEVTEPHQADPELRGYLLEPRGLGRVAAYWIEAGRAVSADDGWDGPSLAILADKLTMAGWTVTRPTGSGICVFAQRPAD
ncbi:hypothetical protein PV410_12595 [Streptomyces sp. PA03-5A]|nr:hypothetical protein [Streptomyces sp. PA03-5A]